MTGPPEAQPELRYRQARLADLEDILNLASEVFAAGEPLARHLELPADGVRAVMHGMVAEDPSGSWQRLSFVAEHAQSGALIGFRIVTAAAIGSDENDTASACSQAEASLSHILNSLSQPMEAIAREHRVAHMMFMGVRKEHEGRGVASQLTKRSLEAVEAEGYKAVYAEATAYGSQAILRDKYGFQVLNEIECEAWMDDHTPRPDRRPFAGITLAGNVPPTAQLLVKYF